mgnify:CR=1 FL=1
MLIQIVLGTGVLMANITVAAVGAFLLEAVFQRAHPWLIAPPQRPKLLLLLIGVGVWVLSLITVAVWVWALALFQMGAFSTLEESMYFSLVAFSTLGLGDVVPPKELRIFAVMASVNGFLSFGLLTALLVEALRQVRLAQLETRQK